VIGLILQINTKPVHITTVWAELVPLTSHSESCASSLSWLPNRTQAVQHSETAKIPRSPSVAPRNLPPSRACVPTFILPLPLGLLLCQRLFISRVPAWKARTTYLAKTHKANELSQPRRFTRVDTCHSRQLRILLLTTGPSSASLVAVGDVWEQTHTDYQRWCFVRHGSTSVLVRADCPKQQAF
jgi:hypothetical protein